METIDDVDDSNDLDYEDKTWVDVSVKWLTEAYGKPLEFVIPEDQRNFPNYWRENTVANAIIDFCALFEVVYTKVNYEIENSNYGSFDLPVVTEGNFNQCLVECTNTEPKEYLIYVPENLLKHPTYLLYKLTLSFSEIALIEDDAPFYSKEHDPHEIDMFMHLAAIYFGFGLVLAKYGESVGSGWNYPALLTDALLGYSLAICAKQTNFRDEDWRSELPSEIARNYKRFKSELTNND